MPKPEKNWTVVAGEWISLATLLPACTFVGWLIGHYLDRWLDTKFLTIVFLLAGIASGLVQIVRKFMRDTEGE